MTDGFENGKDGRATLSVTRPPSGGSYISVNLATWKMVLGILLAAGALYMGIRSMAERELTPVIDSRIDVKDGWLREKALRIEEQVRLQAVAEAASHARYDQALVTAERDRKEILETLKDIDRKIDRRNGDGR